MGFRIVSFCAVAAGLILLGPTLGSATLAMTDAGVVNAAKASSLLVQAKCVKVDGKCKKKHQGQNGNDDKETKTAKLIKQQDSCVVDTPGKGGGGCVSPLIRRCDKLKDGDEVCCCYKVDTSQ